MKLEKNFLIIVCFVIVFIFFNLSKIYGETYIPPGIISSDTWTLADSPYIIQGDIELGPESTLTIEPGVAVQFEAGYNFRVFGNLIAVGAEDQPIIFTSNSGSPNPGDWDGLEFRNSISSGSQLAWCILEYATLGLTCHNCNIVKILNCTIQNNSSDGIKVEAVTFYDNGCKNGNALPEIEGCTIELNSGYGVNYRAAGDVGCINSSPTAIAAGTLINNIIRHNTLSGIGMAAYDGYYANGAATPDIVQNEIYSNEHGIYISPGSGNCSPDLEDNRIIQNTATGVYCRSENGSPVIKYNLISQNGDRGVINANSNIVIGNNQITLNGSHGIETSSLSSFTENGLYDNQGYDFYLDDEENQLATGTYWGTTNPSEIEANIWDHADDAALGNVIYEPFTTEPDTTPP